MGSAEQLDQPSVNQVQEQPLSRVPLFDLKDIPEDEMTARSGITPEGPDEPLLANTPTKLFVTVIEHLFVEPDLVRNPLPSAKLAKLNQSGEALCVLLQYPIVYQDVIEDLLASNPAVLAAQQRVKQAGRFTGGSLALGQNRQHMEEAQRQAVVMTRIVRNVVAMDALKGVYHPPLWDAVAQKLT